MSQVLIYHETQDSALCGQHCLNNLIQQSMFSPINLAAIAQELDQAERNIMSDESNDTTTVKESVNVDASGNFSFDVLSSALKSIYNIELVSWTGEEGRSHIEPENEVGFIINHQEHWYALRKINNYWWNLDSLIERPEHVSPFYLSAYLAQLRNEGSSVFLVRGNLPEIYSQELDPLESNPQALYWEESRLLGTSNNTNSGGNGNMSLQGNVNNNNNNNNHSNNDDDEDDDEDLMMALALSESMK